MATKAIQSKLVDNSTITFEQDIELQQIYDQEDAAYAYHILRSAGII